MTIKDLPQAALAVDLAIFTLRDQHLQVLLVHRGKQPFLGYPALPGGFLESDEDLDTAAARELEEETGLDVCAMHIQQLGGYGDPHRDPRGRVVSICYVALTPDLPLPTAGGDASSAQWVVVDTVLAGSGPPLAFDHGRILEDAVEWVRSQLEYTSLATAFCPSEFTITDLRRVYEIVWGRQLDPPNFHRKVTKIPGLLTPTDKTTAREGGRPARLYRRGSATILHPAILRTS